jgi:hypothetical protein
LMGGYMRGVSFAFCQIKEHQTKHTISAHVMNVEYSTSIIRRILMI